MLIVASSRITVFQQDRGWKYCIADINDRQTPHFSDPYGGQQMAMDEALAHFRGEPARHATVNEDRAEARKEKWESLIQERETLLQELDALISTNPSLKISALHKPLAKIESHLKQIDWQVTQHRNDGVAEKNDRTNRTTSRETARVARPGCGNDLRHRGDKETPQSTNFSQRVTGRINKDG